MPWTHFRPTPEQILEVCEQIRADWDEETHRRRWMCPVREFWTPPIVTAAPRHSDEPDARGHVSPLSGLSGLSG